MKKLSIFEIVVGSICGLFILGCICFLAYHFFFAEDGASSATAFDATSLFASINTQNEIPDYLEIENLIGTAMKTYGTKAGFLLIDEGEKQGIISNDECHGLLHYVGHAAYAEDPYDYDAILSVVEGTSCLGGYIHGVEAEIILQSANVIQDANSFCTYQKEKGVNPGPCFHGAGHAAAELYHYDAHKGLALCDSLGENVELDLSNCYRGIFSEVGNVVVGYDGHTGLATDVLEINGLDPENPYEFCDTFEERHRSSCKSQLTKVFQRGDIDTWLATCTNPTFDTQSRHICMNITSGVYVRSELSFNDTVILPEVINEFDIETQKVAVLGGAEAFSGYFSDNQPKDWLTYCTSYTNTEVKAYCEEVLEGLVERGESAWMERTDIR